MDGPLVLYHGHRVSHFSRLDRLGEWLGVPVQVVTIFAADDMLYFDGAPVTVRIGFLRRKKIAQPAWSRPCRMSQPMPGPAPEKRRRDTVPRNSPI
jgi:hypothetical protein